VPTLRLDSGDPLESLIERLNGFGPEVLVAYASMVKLLAEEQLAGRLRISPGFVFSASEVLTNEAKCRISSERAGQQAPLLRGPQERRREIIPGRRPHRRPGPRGS
jgi:phenylacetate-coenzyme A ligase PaaK-like adenylate-forming protein